MSALYLNLEEEGHMVLVLKAFRILCKVGNIHVQIGLDCNKFCIAHKGVKNS